MLTSVLRALVKYPIKENFDITFMKNEKNVKTLIVFFFFPIKTLFNWILNQCLKSTRLYDPSFKNILINEIVSKIMFNIKFSLTSV